jgi:sterol 3beta-glucosyltransferase
VQVPVHVMFTMPWTPTKEFPHPMAVVQSTNVAGSISALPSTFISGAANWFSYAAMDLYLWAGVSSIIDAFRRHLGLRPYPSTSAAPAHAPHALRLPVTYLWSPSLQPKPVDWGPHTEVCHHPQCVPAMSRDVSHNRIKGQFSALN